MPLRDGSTVPSLIFCHSIWEDDSCAYGLLNKGYARASANAGGDIEYESVFVLANCWRTLSPESCKQCLENASTYMVKGCLPWSEGRALHTGCFLRYSDKDFLNKISTNGRSKGYVVVIVVSVLSVVVVFMV